MAIFTTCGENSNSCEISHFPVSKHTVKVLFSLDVLGKSHFGPPQCSQSDFIVRDLNFCLGQSH